MLQRVDGPAVQCMGLQPAKGGTDAAGAAAQAES